MATTYEVFPDSAGMQSAEEQGPLLAFLVRLTGARHIVEIGTFTGFSSLSMAQAMPADGRLIACDVSEEWTAYAREAWAKAGVADRIDLRIAPAIETLRAMPAEPHIDMVYMDADKQSQIAYWEELVPRLRPGGLLVTDNTLYHGTVLDPAATGGAAGVQAYNDHVAADPAWSRCCWRSPTASPCPASASRSRPHRSSLRHRHPWARRGLRWSRRRRRRRAA